MSLFAIIAIVQVNAVSSALLLLLLVCRTVCSNIQASSTASGPKAVASGSFTGSPSGTQGALTTGAGGAQSSCSSSSATTSGVVTLTSNSVSKSGTCP